MVVEKIGLNLTQLTNTPPPIPEWTNYTATEFINYIPEHANTVTDGYFGIITLITLGIFLFWLLSDRNQFGQYRYSIIRAFGISMGICLLIGMQLIQIGYIVNFVHLAIIMGFYILMNIYVIIKNPY